MASTKIALSAATWTDISTAQIAIGGRVFLITELSDVKVGRKATAPTNGPTAVPGEALEIVTGSGDVLKLWAYSVAGGEIVLFGNGHKVVLGGEGTT